MRILKSIFRYGIIILLAVVILASVHLTLFLTTPVEPPRPIRIDIMRGTSAWEISCSLAMNRIISDATTFMCLGVILMKARNLQAGTYVFEGRHTPIEVMDILYKGRSLRYKITIPEGYDIYDIGNALAATGMFSRDEFITTALKSETAEFFSIDAPSLEGFLFPDTYYFGAHMTPLEIIAKMVQRYHAIYTQEMQSRAGRLGLSEREVITLASLIEKEAVVSEEKPIISSVFHNRLHIGMRLQSDPTAIYGLPSIHRNITPEDLKRESPYNTYLHKGLPPGPICSPGKDSILAALWPSETKHLYFVSRGDGHHIFSSSFREHSKAIRLSNRRRR